MKLLICCFLLLGVGALAEERVRRQATYTFPGPRNERAYRAQVSPVYAEEQDVAEVYPASRRQYQPQSTPQQYAPQQQHRAAQPPPVPVAPSYEAPRQDPAPRSQPAPRRRTASSAASNRANKYGSAPQQSLGAAADEEEEEDQGPDALTLLLQDSQFTCGGKQDGYYADDSVNCQVFHYCVGGAKHSWMCPENTVFHQVHLNCVPDAQDICSQSQKFHFVNDYLYKPIDYEGPNKTARYSQRYYPDGYVVGDPLVAPQEHRRPQPPPPPQTQSYSPPASAPRSPPRHSAPASSSQTTAYRPQTQPQAAPAYRPQTQPQAAAAYRPPVQQARPQPRPQQDEPYSGELPEGYNRVAPEGYRLAQARPAAPPQPYRTEQPVPQSLPPQQIYRTIAAQQLSPQYGPSAQGQPTRYSSEEGSYQPQARRAPSATTSQRSTVPSPAAYAPPRQQYRASARSAATGYQPGYQPQPPPRAAAGVQYDEDY